MRVMGIDPGLADVGYGVIEQSGKGREIRHLAHGVIRTSAGRPMAERLEKIYRELSDLIRLHEPDEIAIEELFFSSNVKTAMVVAQARGVAILATAESKTPLAEYSPPQIKQALVGNGRAAKRQVQMMVRAVLGLEEVPRPDHAADALATAICHLHQSGLLRKIAEAARSDGEASEGGRSNKAVLAQRRRRRRRR